MLIRRKFALYFSTIFVLVAVISLFSIWVNYSINSYLSSDLPAVISDVQHASKLDITAQLIRYDDEVLTQSARNYAFTGDKKWQERYNGFVPKLDLRIKEAIDGGDQQDKQIFESINQANLTLVDLETQAIALVDKGDLISAQKILDGEEYDRQKSIYKSGLEQYLARRGADLESASSVTTNNLEKANSGLRGLVLIQIFLSAIFILLLIAILVFMMFLITRTFMRPLAIFKRAAKEITRGKLDARVEIKNNDEIGDFAMDFNKMTSELQEAIENTEKKIKERTSQLEKINKYMVGREIKMVELKKKIKELEAKK